MRISLHRFDVRVSLLFRSKDPSGDHEKVINDRPSPTRTRVLGERSVGLRYLESGLLLKVRRRKI